MKVFKDNIEKLTLNNNYYRKVIYTTPQMQLVLMSLPTNVEIGKEVHSYTTQFIRVESGKGVAYINKKRFNLHDGDSIVIPPGVSHNIISTDDLKLYTIYSPPEHKSGHTEYNKNC